ncbi:LysR family transcriptional regulator [Jannaschia sp. LMIT008]|uniref:LysR family transcriptional regulator n=1 Tax=Jannaschia maritima TaxID=3032585 RepID=UPI002810EC62|nr:LysR family transcriptional regulator [Jannaschia sp. LMIT008]
MPRNLDLTALRAFATVAQAGGVTRAAALLHLTQSAVSMQLKRLEEALDQRLLERDPRGVRLTQQGEAALVLARRMLALNDEMIERMRQQEPEGEIRLGVPHDIVPHAVPAILRAFAAEYPRIRLTLTSSVTMKLHDMFVRGECDVILGTETRAGPGGEEVVRLPLVWVGAVDGVAFAQRPLRLAFEEACLFRSAAQAALEDAGIPWEVAITACNSRAIDASVSADLACHILLAGFDTGELRPVPAGALPDVGDVAITLYWTSTGADAPRDRLLEIIRDVYRASARRGEAPLSSVA